MKTKRILRFYFAAESLDRAFENLIMRRAGAFAADALECAESVCSLLGEKISLARFWAYLDGIMSALPSGDRETLFAYASARGARERERIKEVRRAVNKFTRRAVRLGEFADGIELADKYYCLLRV